MRLADADSFDLLATIVDRLAAPHEDHCGSECMGGRTDCCWRCAVLEGLVSAVREMNSLEKSAGRPKSIALPPWAAAHRTVTVMHPPSAKHRGKYCHTCWHRLVPVGFDDLLKERYDEDAIKRLSL